MKRQKPKFPKRRVKIDFDTSEKVHKDRRKPDRYKVTEKELLEEYLEWLDDRNEM